MGPASSDAQFLLECGNLKRPPQLGKLFRLGPEGGYIDGLSKGRVPALGCFECALRGLGVPYLLAHFLNDSTEGGPVGPVVLFMRRELRGVNVKEGGDEGMVRVPSAFWGAGPAVDEG